MFIVIFLVVMGMIAVLAVMLSQNMERNRASLAAAEVALADRFGPGDYHVVLPGPRCIGIAWDAETVVMGDSVASATAIPFANVRSADIEIDDVEVTTSRSTTRTNRGSQAIGGAIGGLALGPTGLLIGGLSGSTTTKGSATAERQIKSLKLVVRIVDPQGPLQSFEFVNIGTAGKEEMAKAVHFHALLTQIIEDRLVSNRSNSVQVQA